MDKKLIFIFLVIFSIYLSKMSLASNGLVGYWSFDDCTAKDFSGNGNDGYICGTNCQITPSPGTCTAVMVTGTAAEGGRSILMKNRDFHDTPPKPYYYSKTSVSSDGKYSYVLADMAGMSESGLAIINTLQHQDPADHLKTVQYRIHGPLNGNNKTYAMKYVLSHFSVVDDAVNWLINNMDSADCFGIIDQSSNKGAFVFIDGENKTVQWIVNSYGAVANNWVPDGEYGPRRQRAMTLLNSINASKGYISWEDIAQNISRDQNGTDNTNNCYYFGDNQLISRNMTNANMIAISGNSDYGGKLNIAWFNFHANSQVGIFMPIMPGALDSSSDMPLVFSQGRGLADLVEVKYNYARDVCGDGSFNGTRVKQIHSYSFAAEDYAYNKYTQLISTLPSGLSDTELKTRLKDYMNDAVYFENKTYVEEKVPSSTICTSCGTWTIGSCGGGGCGAKERQYTRTGSPSGCYICPDTLGLSKCVSDSSCADAVTDGPNCINGKVGKAFSFDGINDYIDVGNDISLNPTNAISVAAWIYTRGVNTTSYPRVVSKETSIIANPYALEFFNSTDIKFFIGNGTTETATPNINVNLLNNWVYVVGTYNGTYIKIYVNGQLKGQTAKTYLIPSVTTKVLIGNNPTNDREFNGTIDEVKIYNYALSDSEVSNEYLSVMPPCSGNTKLTLSPSVASPGLTVTATISGVNCNVPTNATVVKTSPSPLKIECSCTVSGNGCSCQFTSPSVGSYTFTGIIDKNGDNDYSDSGETYNTPFTVSTGGGCGRNCFVLAIGPYIWNADITPILSAVSAVLVLIEIVVLMTIYNRLRRTKRKRK